MIKLSSVILVGLLSATGVNDLKVVADRSTTIPQPTATVLIPQAQMPDEQSSENPAERTTWILSAWTERSEPKILLASPEITLNLSPDQFTGLPVAISMEAPMNWINGKLPWAPSEALVRLVLRRS
ncbi:MAG: hypothetical protein HC825_08190 [Oscillatoriales cyanobacterium RM1_1_9]|nr:hypothetical protein [Oscillatoriales cyanobacterium RM1_1_9]